jgi:hypothetical protein
MSKERNKILSQAFSWEPYALYKALNSDVMGKRLAPPLCSINTKCLNLKNFTASTTISLGTSSNKE